MIFSESEPAAAFGYGEASGRFEKDSSPSGNQHILPSNSSPSIDSAPLSEADRLFSFADLRIGKRKLSVLCALSEAGGSSFSLVTLAPGSNLNAYSGGDCWKSVKIIYQVFHKKSVVYFPHRYSLYSIFSFLVHLLFIKAIWMNLLFH